MGMRRTIGAVMVALLVLAAPLPAMCSQCPLATTKPNAQTIRIQAPASPGTSSEVSADEHCHHLAKSQSGSAARLVSTRLCQDRPCQELLDAAPKMNRGDFTQPEQSFRSLASTAGSGDHFPSAKDFFQSRFETRSLIPLMNQALSLSLRI
jgi:hypothetical protein